MPIEPKTYVVYADLLDDWGPTESELYTRYVNGDLPPEVAKQFEQLFLVQSRLLTHRALSLVDRIEKIVEHCERRIGNS